MAIPKSFRFRIQYGDNSQNIPIDLSLEELKDMYNLILDSGKSIEEKRFSDLQNKLYFHIVESA